MRLTAQRRALILEALALAEQSCQCDADELARTVAKHGLKAEFARLLQTKAKHANDLARRLSNLRSEMEGE